MVEFDEHILRLEHASPGRVALLPPRAGIETAVLGCNGQLFVVCPYRLGAKEPRSRAEVWDIGGMIRVATLGWDSGFGAGAKAVVSPDGRWCAATGLSGVGVWRLPER